MSPDIAASIRARLLSKAKEQGDELELILVRYAIERFLYRLGASHMREQCVLKGATLLTLWLDDPYRASRDVDFHAAGPSSEAAIMAIVTTVCAVPCAEDGIRFDLESLHVSPIREEAESGGQRAILRAYLGKARIRLQIDFGFGDAVTPAPEDSNSPTLLQGLPSSRLRTYPMVVSIAEKFEALVTLGQRNSRLKDFL